MKIKLVFVERKFWQSVSLERVFSQIEKNISKKKFDTSFVQLPYLSTFSGIIKNLLYFKKPEADIYHITGHVHFIGLIMPVKNTVLTIPDLTILRTRKGLRRSIIKKLFYDLPIKRLKYITAISQETKNEIIKHIDCDEDKIRVIDIPLSDKLYLDKKKPFNAECPLILQIGTAPHKNVINLVKALKDVNCRLRIIGKIDESLQKELDENKIKYTSDAELSDTQIRDEYEKADIAAFCSTYEGFGLPIIEAQAMRTPVITSDRNPMREIAGGAAVLIDPENISSITSGILQVVNNQNLREKLLEKGLINIKRFEANHIAGLYEELYSEVLENSDK